MPDAEPGAPDGGAPGVRPPAAGELPEAVTRPLPRPLRSVHLIGVGGTGMGSLAALLHGRGYRVTGSDRAVHPPMSTELERRGIPVELRFDAARIERLRPELVVIGNACRSDNPEARAALQSRAAVRSFPDALFELFLRDRIRVAVCGTHGKTTTTALLATVLAETGRDPSVLLGGVAENLGGGVRDGRGSHFVVEGDEYDTAFFDKTPKFLHYRPHVAILTSVEFDHADIYADLDAVKAVFRELATGLPTGGALVAAVDHASVREVARASAVPVVGYGEGREATFRADEVRIGPEGTAFRLLRKDEPLGRGRISLHGRHHLANALAALAAAEVLGVPPEEALPALAAFRGVRRRQELRGTARGVTVLDDFAHHPTAVRETLAATRARFPGRRLVAVLEPRSNTSRRRLFEEDYARALAGADRVLVCEPEPGPIYDALGRVPEPFSAERVAELLREPGPPARALPDAEAILSELLRDLRPGDVVLVMSNGDFRGLPERLLRSLEAGAPGA